MVVADNLYGLHVLNVSDLNNVYELCNASSYDRLTDLVVDENLIFGADMLAGIHVYNATNKNNVTSVTYTLVTLGEMEPHISVGARPNLGNWETQIGEGEYLSDFLESAFGVELSTLISKGNKTFFKITPIEFTLTPIIIYNDTDGDGKLSICYEVHPDNPYLIMRRVITDQVFFTASFDDIHAKFSQLEKETWHGHEAYYYTLEVFELNFTNNPEISGLFYDAYADNVIGNSAKGNVTFTFHFIPFENTNQSSPFLYDNLTVKADIDLTLYDIDWSIAPEEYCVAIGFNSRLLNDLVYYPAYSLLTSRGSSLRAMDVIGDLFINENFTAMDDNYLYNGTVNVSFDYAWEDFSNNFEMVNRHIVFANFINIPHTATKIRYDPRLGFYTIGKQAEISLGFHVPTHPYTGEEEQPPEERPTAGEEGEQPPPRFGMSPTVMFVAVVVVVSVVAVVVKFVKRRH